MFEKERINKGRQDEIDIAKAIIIISFAFVHITIECVSEETLMSGLPYFLDTIWGGPLGAPVLMFSMGVGMVYARNNSSSSFFNRGLKLFGLSFLFNLLRYVIPYLIAYGLTGDYDHFIQTLMYHFFNNDILQFAGLTFMFMAILIKLGLSEWMIFIIAFIMSIIGNFANGLDFHSQALNVFLGYFIGVEDEAEMVLSYFVFLNWFIVVAAGYLFGNYLIRVNDKKKFYLAIGPISIIISIAYFIHGISNKIGMFGDGQSCYYHITTPDVVITLFSTVAIFSIYYLLTLFLPKKIIKLFNILSSLINIEYCIHWVLVTVIIYDLIYPIRGSYELTMDVIMLISIFVSGLSIWLAYIWKFKKKKRIAIND